MRRKLVTCPDTAHLEEIEYVETPLGVLIAGCSRFSSCPLSCPRTCAMLMDLKNALAHPDGELRTGTVLLARSCLR